MSMNILNGIQNVLEYIDNNWAAIAIILALIASIAKKINDFLSKTEEERISIAKKQISEIMLKLITDAETDYKSWIEAGAVKRSQVINQIFEMYPVLLKATNQEEIIIWIDGVIDDSLKTMRKIFAKQIDDKIGTTNELEDMSVTEEEMK